LNLSFFVVATVTALSWVVVALPVSWMGVGTSELSFLLLLSLQGVSRESAVALSLHQSAIHLLTALLCVPLLLWVVARIEAEPES
ncbi:MAG: hypothetical protein CMH53_07900, partial [Myxococcales bacterium]|nr:hypothetical protein [Myxococcales bacterium]